MLQVSNSTPFDSGIAVFPSPDGIDTLYIRLKATFDLLNKPTVAEKQAPLNYEDVYWGDPGNSSLRYPADMLPAKPSTDVLMVGEACLPNNKRVSQLDVTLAIGKRKKVVRIFGDRAWTGAKSGSRTTRPIPFKTMPLVFERAFGGVRVKKKNEIAFESRNPVGKGLVEPNQEEDIKGLLLPNLEDPHHLLKNPGDRPSPISFGPTAPSWDPRKSFAGTYDEAWEKSRAPYLPKDFNSQFFNTAPPDLQFNPYLKGGEAIEIQNASPDGVVRCVLPVCELAVSVRKAGKEEIVPIVLETVIIEPTARQFTMVWGSSYLCDKSALKIQRINLGMNNLDV